MRSTIFAKQSEILMLGTLMLHQGGLPKETIKEKYLMVCLHK